MFVYNVSNGGERAKLPNSSRLNIGEHVRRKTINVPYSSTVADTLPNAQVEGYTRVNSQVLCSALIGKLHSFQERTSIEQRAPSTSVALQGSMTIAPWRLLFVLP